MGRKDGGKANELLTIIITTLMPTIGVGGGRSSGSGLDESIKLA